MGTNVLLVQNKSTELGWCLGYDLSESVQIFYVTIDSKELQGPNGSIYLSNWLTVVRVAFYEAKEMGYSFHAAWHQLSNLGLMNADDKARM